MERSISWGDVITPAPQKDNPTLNDLFYQCYEERVERKTISEATYTRYENIYKKYYGDSPLGKKKIMTLSEHELSEFIISAVYDKKMKAKEFGLLRTVTTGMLKCAKRQGYTNISPTLFFSDLDLGKKSFARARKNILYCQRRKKDKSFQSGRLL